MKKKLIAFVAVASLLAIGLLAGCSCSSNTGGTNLGDGKATFEGKTLTITLPSNETTGYTWSYSIDGDTIKNTVDKYEADATAKNVSGAGGTQTYEFEGTGQGKATITLTYARSWEQTDSDLKYEATVETDSSGKITSLNTVG